MWPPQPTAIITVDTTHILEELESQTRSEVSTPLGGREKSEKAPGAVGVSTRPHAGVASVSAVFLV